MPATRHYASFAFVALASATAACALDAETIGATGSFDRTLMVSGAVDLSVRTGSGSITVYPGAADTVRIVGHIRARGFTWSETDATEEVRGLESDPPISQSANVIEVGTTVNRSLGRNVSISYDITVPRATRMRSQTGSGAVSIGDINGPVEAEAGSGSIQAGRIDGHVSASTGSGRIYLNGGRSLEARAGSGSITAEAVEGKISAKTGSGNVDVVQTGPGDVEISTGSGWVGVKGAQGSLHLRTGSGSVTVEGTPADEWSVHTGSGSVTVHVPPSASFNLDARTGSGSIHTARPVQVFGALSQRHVRARVGNGGALVELSTSSGGIRLD